MTVGMVGLGKLGLPVAVAMAMKGHDVIGYDIDAARMTKDAQPYQETGPEGTGDFNDWLAKSTIRFGTLKEVVEESEIIFIAVQTPHAPLYEGVNRLPDERVDFDYSHLIHAVRDVLKHATPGIDPPILAVISTVLPGTMARDVVPLIQAKSIETSSLTDLGKTYLKPVKMVYNPSFIAMGTTMRDLLKPEFVLLGGNRAACEKMAVFYTSICEAPSMVMSIESAELTKVAYNTFISLKIAFANTIMEVCESIPKADCDEVAFALKAANKRLISRAYMNGGMGDGGGCFPPGEVVMTATGPRPIEEIRGGDLVLTHTGALRPVVRTWEREFDGELIGVTTRGCPQTWMTGNHPLFVTADRRSIVPDGRRDNRLTLSETMSPVVEVLAEEIKREHLVGWPSECVEPSVSLPSHATDEYIELGGWWLSEGSCELTTRRGRLRFDLHAKEADDGKRIAELLTACAVERTSGRGANARLSVESNGEHGMAVRFGNMGLAELLVADFGKGAAAKRLPAWALWGSEKTARLLLRGMIRGDGHLAASVGRVSFSTISRDLAWGAFILLSRLGLDPTVRNIPPRVGADGQSHTEAWETRVGDAGNVRALCEIVGWDHSNLKPRSFKRFEVYGKRDGTTWRPVFKVERKHYRGTVYNLWVSRDNSYVIQAGAVHNCHPRDNIAMSWLARRLGLSFDLFESAMVCREKQARWLAKMMAEEATAAKLPMAILGIAFKPETNLTVGSPSTLVANLTWEFGQIPPALCDDTVGTKMKEATVSETPAVYLVGCRHERYQRMRFAPGSIVIDPHRYIPDSSSGEYKVHRLGEGRG